MAFAALRALVWSVLAWTLLLSCLAVVLLDAPPQVRVAASSQVAAKRAVSRSRGAAVARHRHPWSPYASASATRTGVHAPTAPLPGSHAPKAPLSGTRAPTAPLPATLAPTVPLSTLVPAPASARARAPAAAPALLSAHDLAALSAHVTYELSVPSGTPVWRLRDVCISSHSLTLMPRSRAAFADVSFAFAFCCSPDGQALARRSRSGECLGQANERFCSNSYGSPLGLYAWPSFAFNISDPATRQPHEWAGGVNLLLDTAINGTYQYGHAVSRFVQAAVVDASLNVTRFVFNKHHRPPRGPRERNLRGIYNMTLGASGLPVVFTAGQPFCARELLYIPDYEKSLWTPEQAQLWRARAGAALALTWPECPPPRAVLLTRPASDAGATRRAITNPHVLRAVASELGIAHVETVTIGSANTTRETAALFASFGLMVSPHSSQLKSLLFASPNAVVVEVGGSHLPLWRPTPFRESMAELGVLFAHSRFHTTNVTACGAVCRRDDKNADVTLDAVRLKQALENALRRQREACPRLSYA
jgi:hypothetical protein